MNNEELVLDVRVPLAKCASTVKIEKTVNIEFSGYEEDGIPRLLAYDVVPDTPACMVIANGVYVKGHVEIKAFGTIHQSDNETGMWVAYDDAEYETVVKCENFEDRENIKCRAEANVVAAEIRPGENSSIEVALTLSITVKIIENRSLNMISGLGDDESIRVRTKPAAFRNFEGDIQESEKAEEKIVLPQSKPAVDRILYSNSRIKDYSIRQNPGYYEVSGDAGVFIVYLADEMSGGSGEMLQTGEFAIPFNFVVNAEGVPENAEFTADIHTGDLVVSAAEDEDGEKRRMDISMEISVGLECYSTIETEIPDDVFGIGRRLELVETVSAGNVSVNRQNGSIPCVKAIEMDTGEEAPELVLMSAGKVRDISLIMKDDKMMLAGSAEANVIYTPRSEESGRYRNVKIDIPFQQELEGYVPDGKTEYTYSAEVDNCRSIVTMGNVLETKMDIRYTLNACENPEIIVPTGIREAAAADNAVTADDDSMIMYVVGANDDTWTIAKRFLVSPENILTADGFPVDDEPTEGSRVFIV